MNAHVLHSSGGEGVEEFTHNITTTPHVFAPYNPFLSMGRENILCAIDHKNKTSSGPFYLFIVSSPVESGSYKAILDIAFQQD